MNHLLVKHILISAVVVVCMARPRDRREVRLAEVEESVNDFKELLTNFGSDSPDAKATYDVHSSGEHFITICWNEKTVIQLYPDGDLNGYIDYSISLQLAPRENSTDASNATATDLYEVNDVSANTKRVLQFVTVKQTDDVTIKENRTSNCRLGQMYARTLTQLPPKKRVEIKLRSQLNKQDLQSLGLTSRKASGIHQRLMVSSEEGGDQEASPIEERRLESTEALEQSITATTSSTDPDHLTMLIDVSPSLSAAPRRMVSSEESNSGDSTITPQSDSDVTTAKAEEADGQDIITATERMGGDSLENLQDAEIDTLSIGDESGETISMRREGVPLNYNYVPSTPKTGEVLIGGNYPQSLDSSTGNANKEILIIQMGRNGQTGNLGGSGESISQTMRSLGGTSMRHGGKLLLTENYIHSLGNGESGSVKKAGATIPGAEGSLIFRKEGSVPITNYRVIETQTRNGVPLSSSLQISGGGSGESLEKRIEGGGARVPLNGNKMRSLDSNEGGGEFGADQTSPIMSCEGNNKLKIKVRFGIVDSKEGKQNVEKEVVLDLKKFRDGKKGDDFEDALYSLVRSYYGDTLNKYIDECVAGKSKKVASEVVKNRALQDDYYVDTQSSYMNPYGNVPDYQYQYSSNSKVPHYEVPSQHSGSFYMGSDGRYYVLQNPQVPPASESIISKLTRRLKSAFSHI